MSVNLGDFKLGETIDFGFSTVNTSSVPTTLAGSPTLAVYDGNSTTQLATGTPATLTVDFDALTGGHNVRIVATVANGYARRKNYRVVLFAGTVGGVSVVGSVLAHFSVENRNAAGLIHRGVAAAVGASTITHDAALIVGDNALRGAVYLIVDATTGRAQSRTVLSNVGATGIDTVDTWDPALTGTVEYELYAGSPGSASAPPAANVTQWLGATAPAAPATQASVDAVQADLPQKLTKNVAFPNFTFPMVLSSDGRTGATGLTVTATRRIDNGSFAACANAVTEIGSGDYTIDLAASDLNGDAITLRFTATGADTRRVFIITQRT